ncbi:MAG: hypothetical protein O3C34_07390 [Proteobacteria bacterium]|nr:hypothetical protein [Pseudomonadota bacterium]
MTGGVLAACRVKRPQGSIRSETQMAFPEKLPNVPPPIIENDPEGQSLRKQAVAIDPPPVGAIGIEELLGRFERFAEARALTDFPESGPVGVRELLTRLGGLAGAGYFSPSKDDESDEK